MIAVIDYGVGNLFSLCSSLEAIGAQSVVTSAPDVIKQADKIILPGVGAFGDAIRKLRKTGLDEVIINEVAAGKPIFGICLGMQLLFEKSYEYGEHTGLGLLRGSVVPMDGSIEAGLKIPHIGWNALKVERKHPLMKYTAEGYHVYFVHSYFAVDCDDSLVASSEYGARVTALVASGNVAGAQFHPEKSGEVGLNILRAFCEWEGK